METATVLGWPQALLPPHWDESSPYWEVPLLQVGDPSKCLLRLSAGSLAIFPFSLRTDEQGKGTDDNILPSFTAGNKDEQLCLSSRVSAGSWQVVHGPWSVVVALGTGRALNPQGEGKLILPLLSNMDLESLLCKGTRGPLVGQGGVSLN